MEITPQNYLPIETPRFIIRDLEMDDWESVHSYASVPETSRYMIWGPNTEEDTQNFIKRVIAHSTHQPRTHYSLTAYLKEEKKIIGGCDIRFETSGHNHYTGSIGYCLHPDYWLQGYGTEMAQAMIEFGFTNLQMHRIFATCDVENIASIRVLEKSGMTKEGCMREHVLLNNKWRNSYLYAILIHEWE